MENCLKRLLYVIVLLVFNFLKYDPIILATTKGFLTVSSKITITHWSNFKSITYVWHWIISKTAFQIELGKSLTKALVNSTYISILRATITETI